MPPLALIAAHDLLTKYLKQKGAESPRVASEILIAHTLKISRIGIYAGHEAPVSEENLQSLRELARRHVAGEPLPFLVGKVSFFSFEFEVERGVFCPRPETELLVEKAAEKIRAFPGDLTTLRAADLCCGSGVVGLSIAKLESRVLLTATDISERAIEMSRRNALKLGVEDRVTPLQCDLFDGLEKGAFHAVLCNPPYVPSGDIAGLGREVREYDPIEALDGGKEGLDYYRTLASQAPDFLTRDGLLALELGIGQWDPVRGLLETSGAFKDIETFPDLAGIPRVLTAIRK